MPDSESNKEEEKNVNTLLAGLVFVPPLVLDLCSQENVFEAALDFGGTYGDLTLFGIILASDMPLALLSCLFCAHLLFTKLHAVQSKSIDAARKKSTCIYCFALTLFDTLLFPRFNNMRLSSLIATRTQCSPSLQGLIPVGMVWSQRGGYAKQRTRNSSSKDNLLHSPKEILALTDDFSVGSPEISLKASTESSSKECDSKEAWSNDGIANSSDDKFRFRNADEDGWQSEDDFKSSGASTIAAERASSEAVAATGDEVEDVLVPGGYPILMSLAGASALLIATYTSEILVRVN